MSHQEPYDCVVVGAGPNGLAAAITLARQGFSVLLREAADEIGGGTRSAELTLPGFTHDICSAIHPLALASPFFRSLSLESHGLRWTHPPAPVAHPLDGGEVVMLEHDLEQTADQLGADGHAYMRLLAPYVAGWKAIVGDLLGPLRIPRHPMLTSRFSLQAVRSATGLINAKFRETPARALFAGLAAHTMLPLETHPSAAAALLEATLAHAVGWPMAAGGSQNIALALAKKLRSLGGEIVTGDPLKSLAELDAHRAAVLNLTPRQVLSFDDGALPSGYRRRLGRFRYGPGVFKLDWALEAPIPWEAPGCARAATVHLGGTFEEIAHSERQVWDGTAPDQPYVILVQQSGFDPSRAPEGKHTAWGYCHVPHASAVDMTSQIEAQVERFAPGFQSRILARHSFNALEMEAHNPNYVGGDINGGVADLRQLFTRPLPQLVPYRTPMRGVFLGSSSTPPGGGVHGMCGYFAARSALKFLRT